MDPTPSSPASAPRPRSLVWTLISNLYLVVFTIVFGVLATLTGWIGGGRVFYFWARTWSRGLLAASGLGVRARFEAEVPPGPYLVMPNHQSLYDIPLLLSTLPVRARFMAKKELFDLPIFGWALRVGGFIPVDRGKTSSSRAAFSAALERLAEGSAVLIFPEETRSRDGSLLPFKRGGFLLALKSGAPILPVGIRGTLAVRSKDSYVVRPGVVEATYGAPVAVAGRSVAERAELLDEVRREVARLAGVDPGTPPEPPPISSEPPPESPPVSSEPGFEADLGAAPDAETLPPDAETPPVSGASPEPGDKVGVHPEAGEATTEEPEDRA